MCVMNTPIDEVVKAFYDILEALRLLRGISNASPNKSVLAIQKNMSKDMYDWYVEYCYIVAQRQELLLRKGISLNIPDNFSELLEPSFAETLPETLEWVDNPLYNSEYGKYTEKLSPESTIMVSRAIIILMSPVYENFLTGVPNWLAASCPVVLTAYDEDNRRHIKITNDGKRFHYFTSIISDNYQEITSVPEEIDKIVSYLISSKGSLALADGREVDDFI